MEERAAVIGASVIGVLAVGGILLMSRRRDSFAPNILGVRVIPAKAGLPSYVEIDVEPSDAMRRFGQEGESWEYRVAEPGGRIYLDQINSDEKTRRLRVPYAYGRPPVAPEVQVLVEGTQRGSTRIASMPLPTVSRLATRSGEPIRAFHLPKAEAQSLAAGDPERHGGLGFSPAVPILPKERWMITVLQTPLQSHIGADAKAWYADYTPRLYSGPQPVKARSAIAPLYYAEDITAVRVRVRRILHCTRSERIVLRGLRLSKVNGQTALVWNDSIAKELFGLDLHVLPKSLGFVDYSRSLPPEMRSDPGGDHREPWIDLDLMSGNDARNLSTEDPWIDNATLMSLDGPDLDRLNIRSLGIGNASWRPRHEFHGPVDTRPFSVALTVTKQWDEDRGTFEATVPVEPTMGL